jgi:hypothetical protein
MFRKTGNYHANPVVHIASFIELTRHQPWGMVAKFRTPTLEIFFKLLRHWIPSASRFEVLGNYFGKPNKICIKNLSKSIHSKKTSFWQKPNWSISERLHGSETQMWETDKKFYPRLENLQYLDNLQWIFKCGFTFIDFRNLFVPK